MKVRFCSQLACVVMALVLAACQPDTSVRSPQPKGTVELAAHGDDVARQLNALYADTRPKCDDDKPAYFCSGVLVRAVIWGPNWYFWNNPPTPDYTGVAFSYLRRDMGARETFYDQGFVFAPAETWGRGGIAPLSMHCSFAFDGDTGPQRGVRGCDAHMLYPGVSRPCAEQGIHTVGAFARHFVDVPPTGLAWAHQCSFGTDWQSFLLSILARQGGALEEPGYRYSEQVISKWPEDIPRELPLTALFVSLDGYWNPADALAQVRAMQSDYLAVTGTLLPILRFHSNTKCPAFTFEPADQGATQNPRFIRPPGLVPKGGAPAGWHDPRYVNGYDGKSPPRRSPSTLPDSDSCGDSAEEKGGSAAPAS